MKVQDIDLCGNAATYPVFSAIWTMVSGTFYNSGYAQIGWNKFSVNGSILFYNFWEWTECIGGCADHAALTASSPDVGSYHEYKVSYKSDKSLHMYIDGYQYAATTPPSIFGGFDPVAKWEVSGWPLEADWFNETDHQGNDIAGSSTALQVNWTHDNVKWSTDSTDWHDMLTNGGQSQNDFPCAYNRTVDLSPPGGIPNFQTWTWKPSHAGCPTL